MGNLIVFYTDQLRKDSLGCYGNPVARTPNLDALASRGVRFENHYASNTVCSPSRASFFTGRHLQAHRLIDNGFCLPRCEVTLPQACADAGYRTHAVGKLHLTPMMAPVESGCEESWAVWNSGALDDWNGPYYGFQTVELALGHGSALFTMRGHYGDYVTRNFPELAAQKEEARAGKFGRFGLSSLPIEAHHSTWVADRSIDFIRANADKPFMLFASFPDPHHPFVCPDPYFGMFESCEFPEPHRREGENDSKPIHYRRAMNERLFPKDGGAGRPLDYTEDDWRTTFQATHGMVSLIDASVGRVIDCLREFGIEDNTTIVFTSDHGDLMGDHFFLHKGPMPCRSLLNIPFIVADPETKSSVCDAVMSNADAMPTMLDLIGVPIPDRCQGVSMKEVMAGGPVDEEHVALESYWSKESPSYYHHTMYGPRYRITYFPFQEDGELYDLEPDPWEFENLYHRPERRELRDELMLRLFREVGRAEPPAIDTVAWW